MWISIDPRQVEEQGMAHIQERMAHYAGLAGETASKYRDAMMTKTEEGTLECDSDAVVSLSDNGAYVMTWSWVGDEEIEEEGDDKKGIGIKEMETNMGTVKQSAKAREVLVKLSKVAVGQLIQVAAEKRRIEDVTPGVLAELTQAGMFTQYTPKLAESQTVEWQVKRNKEALAKLAHWAKNACPKDPFKGGPLGGKSGYANGRHQSHPAAQAWDEIQMPREYKACPKTVLSEAAWEMLKGLGIEQPKEGDEGKPCGNR